MVNTESNNQPLQTVAVIGGGIAGLSCAIALQQSGLYSPTVFDTGRLRPGGRSSSRFPGDRPKDKIYKLLDTTIIDHAAQILTIPQGFPHFAKQVQQWEEMEIVKQFPIGTVCNIIDNDASTNLSLKPLPGKMYHGVQGMGSIANHMIKGLVVEQDVWVSPSNGVTFVRNGGWKVKGNGKSFGQFDKLVIAHNGKCADRLMSQTPAKELHQLLQVNFAPEVPSWGGKKMTLNSIYSLTFAVKKDTSPLSHHLPKDKFTCGFVQNHPDLRFLSCNSRKYPGGREDIEIWTVLSSAKFAKKYKGPQENLPDAVVEEVTELLLTSLEQSLHLDTTTLLPMVLESRLQLWGAGVPVNTWKADGFLYDATHGVGTCGDWLLDSSMAGAWESGRRLAAYMETKPSNDAGLNGQFVASKEVGKVGIGSLK